MVHSIFYLQTNIWNKTVGHRPNAPANRTANYGKVRGHDGLAALAERDYGGVLLTDPLNIRYATDSTNMQLWNTHNPFRAVLLCADGYMVIWDYKNSPFLSEFNPLVREQRSGADLFYFDRGDKVDVAADVFSNEVRVLLSEHAPGNMRLAVDKVMLHGLRALEAQGLDGDAELRERLLALYWELSAYPEVPAMLLIEERNSIKFSIIAGKQRRQNNTTNKI